MAYSAVTKPTVGDANKKELWDGLIDNQADFQTRISSLESSSAKIPIHNGWIELDPSASSLTGYDIQIAHAPYDITECFIQLGDKGSISSGTLEIDILLSSSINGTYTSIFSTQPSLNLATAASYDKSTNQVIDSLNQSVSDGDYIRLDITSIPTGLGQLFIKLVGEPA